MGTVQLSDSEADRIIASGIAAFLRAYAPAPADPPPQQPAPRSNPPQPAYHSSFAPSPNRAVRHLIGQKVHSV